MTTFFGGTRAYSQRQRNNLGKRDSILTVLSVKKTINVFIIFLKMIFLAWIFHFMVKSVCLIFDILSTETLKEGKLR